MRHINAWLGLCLFILAWSGAAVCQNNDADVFDALGYLERFGYYNVSAKSHKPAQHPASHVQREDGFHKALRDFQQFVGLPVTGLLDSATASKMKQRRCGMPDVSDFTKEGFPTRKWEKNELLWSVDHYSNSLDKGTIRRAMYEAFHVWSEVTPLEFREVHSESANSDLRIKFEAGLHSDPWAFDGPGRVLAHAFYPPDGRSHFDDDEQWIYQDDDKRLQYEYTDLLAVAIHEIGHALGLAHSTNYEAVMAPMYQASDPDFKPHLHQDDIQRIQALYGARRQAGRTWTTSSRKPTPTTRTTRRTTTQTTTKRATTQTTTTTTTRRATRRSRFNGNRVPRVVPTFPFLPAAPRCPSHIEAVCQGANGIFIFSGGLVWEVKRNQLKSPMGIRTVFRDGPSTVSAAVFNKRTGLTLLFEGRKVWRFSFNEDEQRFQLDERFPRTLPSSISFVPKGAFIWKDGNIVLFGDRLFATYSDNWNLATTSGRLARYFPFVTKTTVGGFPINTTPVFFTESGYFELGNEEEQPLQKFIRCVV